MNLLIPNSREARTALLLQMPKKLWLNAAFSCQSCNKTQAEPDRTKNKVEEKQCKTALDPIAKDLIQRPKDLKVTILLNLLKLMILNRILKSMFLSNLALLAKSAILQTYLDRQARNEYVNLASQMAYDRCESGLCVLRKSSSASYGWKSIPWATLRSFKNVLCGSAQRDGKFVPMKVMTTS